MSDDDANNLVAAGAVLVGLMRGEVDVDVILNDEGQPTNAMVVTFPFLASPYRLTIERVLDAAEKPEVP